MTLLDGEGAYSKREKSVYL
ncbi:hypothetical protein ACT7DF_09275 [Bacillus cereus]